MVLRLLLAARGAAAQHNFFGAIAFCTLLCRRCYKGIRAVTSSFAVPSHLTPDHAGAKQHRPSTQQKKPSDSPVGDVAVLHAHAGSIECQTTARAAALVRASIIPPVELRLRLSNLCSSGLEFVCR